jgi:hypothetical protein
VRQTLTKLAVAAMVMAAAAPAGPRAAPPAPVPVVVELFTAEGCSSCPPADTLLEQLVASQPVAGAEIVALGEHVDYWDRLGWKDRFSSAAATARQQGYQRRFRTDSIYTPQMVVDGRTEFVGSDMSAARRAIEHAVAVAHGAVRIASAAGNSALQVTVTAGELPASGDDTADIVVALTEDRLQTDVKRGENHGRVLKHAAVVRYLASIGQAGGADATAHAEFRLAADWRRDALKVIAFVQQRRGRAILASAAVPVENSRP